MRVEKLNESASAKIKAIAATKFKGVRSRPTDNSMNACALVAAKLAHKHGMDHYVIPAHGGMVISPRADAAASYNDFGYGIRVTAAGDLFTNPLVTA